ncbi:helix-turn-helix transcriptional regulator [Isoptericola cucumis]|uniref:Transcriptional regulator n=1 Tax=Isoptericola cucumis TaxID=1776856 RepID=A0ABQ2B303_9MICO|nr:helix-turn-helix domain-containing protein [Isoptericola cucumis]GGI06700.1 transcriptional regulator [Isoptericola cucumis]
MTTTQAAPHAPAAPVLPVAVDGPYVAPGDTDGTTRRRVLELVAAEGPVTAAELAATLGLTSAAVRRHLGVLEDEGTITVHEAGPSAGRRGRPARRYVVSTGGQSELSGGYSELAVQVMRHLRATGGSDAVARFAAERYDTVVRRYAPHLTAATPDERAAQLAALLTDDGYAASVRPVAGPLVPTVQLCQGHCPVQHVAEEFTELCEAEAKAFSQLLGTHVQRLATIAGGAHACVTNVPTALTAPTPTPADRRGGTQEGTR